MKKAFVIAAAVVLSAACTACGAGNVTVSGTQSAAVSSAAPAVSSSQASSEASPERKVDAAKYEDSLTGLVSYLGACGYVQGNGTKTEFQLIGAKSGYRYTGYVEKKETVTAEFYAYDPSNLNDTAKKVLDSVKQNGSFTLFGKVVPAVLSDSGKYLMIYQDTSSADANTTRKKEVTEAFKSYKA